MPYLPEPAYQHGAIAKTGILLINLGTPDAPTPQALRPYLRQFLSDPRVVEIPRVLWWPILHGVILNTRPKKSAQKYAQIWTSEGSPLLVHTRRQSTLLRGFLGERTTSPLAVEFAMRYGNPDIIGALDRLKQQNCDRILVFPLYPQYSASATASALDAVFAACATMRNVPAVRTIKHYHDHPAYIAALADSVTQYWTQNGRPKKLLMSFHGVPRFSLDKGDPYHCECQKTARLLAEALNLDATRYQVSFQSRFGRAEWLKPYTAATLQEWGKQGVRRVDVICPGFTSDCLETLEEIAMECKSEFLSNGGKEFHYIPALNENDAWLRAMAQIALENLQGWLEQDRSTAARLAGESRTRAVVMGAPQ